MATPLVEQLLDRTIQMLQNETLRKKIQLMILQPFLHWCIELVFPYVILLCVLFGVMIVLMISIVGLLVYSLRGPPPVVGSLGVATAAAAAAAEAFGKSVASG